VNGLGVESGDGRDLVEPAVPEPSDFQGGDPPPLLFVEPAEDPIEPPMVLRADIFEIPVKLLLQLKSFCL
jgi:hypothetical protein